VDLQKFTTIACWLNGVFDYQRWSKNERDWALSLIGFITREIWKSRCKAVFKGGAPEPIGLLARADRAAKEFLDANILPLHHHPSLPTLDSDSVWFPPHQGSVKVNIDGSWKNGSCKAGLGIVIRNSDGLLCAGQAGPYQCISALHAEAAAAIKGLHLASQNGFAVIVLETDSKVLVEGVNGSTLNRAWSILPLLEEIRLLCRNFQAVRWNWVSRKANRAAHKAASIGYEAVELKSWAHRPPQSLYYLSTKKKERKKEEILKLDIREAVYNPNHAFPILPDYYLSLGRLASFMKAAPYMRTLKFGLGIGTPDWRTAIIEKATAKCPHHYLKEVEISMINIIINPVRFWCWPTGIESNGLQVNEEAYGREHAIQYLKQKLPSTIQYREMHSRNKKAMELIAKGWSALKEVDRVIDYCELNDSRLIPLLRAAKENFELALEADNSNTHARGAALLVEAANMGDSDAQYELGCKLRVENEHVQSDQQAFHYLEKAVDQLHPGALYLLGAVYLTGDCVKKDVASALWCFHRASDKGHAGAAIAFGSLLLQGVEIPESVTKFVSKRGSLARTARKNGESLVTDPIEMARERFHIAAKGDVI
ncbi:hypothetical protein Prudu_020678, partial [Prunus dulcis]